ncbi:hypothetical protein PAP18089_04177 [Pandoraea apista]|uniref:Uncharacterized protein n=1 Tax=Pandoraea apista TaxID=93218 RepID=A0A5E5PA18_9BURK|nr:hypothetical protein PAP18089_04177 [Pandoraea apista]
MVGCLVGLYKKTAKNIATKHILADTASAKNTKKDP